MPRSQTTNSFWEERPSLEQMEAAQASERARPAETAGWGSGGSSGGYTDFGKEWYEALDPGAASAAGSTVGAAGAARADGLESNLKLIHGIAAPQVFTPVGPKRKRDRDWEKTHNDEILRLSSFPLALHEKVLGLSDELQVNVGTVAQTLLAYALDAYRRGRLQLKPSLSQGKWTLFPTGAGSLGWKSGGGIKEKKTIKAQKKGRGGKAKKNNLVRVGYRDIPAEIQSMLRELADQKDVPLSEVGRLMIEFAIVDYENGAMEFQADNA